LWASYHCGIAMIVGSLLLLASDYCEIAITVS
jgi:hypothetical protein